MISQERGREAAGDVAAGTRGEPDRRAGQAANAVDTAEAAQSVDAGYAVDAGRAVDAGQAVEVLRAVWSARGQSAADIEELLGPQRSCKAMRDVGFDGMADSAADLRSAWRDTLERDGKLSRDGGSVRDLVLGRPDDRAE